MSHKDIRDFLFRGLMFESEATQFHKAGIKVGADSAYAESRILDEKIAPFSIARRNSALQMAHLYTLLFCFENEIRDFTRERLLEVFGADWVEKLPAKVKDQAITRQQNAVKDSWLEGEKIDLLGFVDFSHLSQIIIGQWEHFKDIIPSQHWLSQRMEDLEKARNFIAHNRLLLPSEFQRMYMIIADWNKVVGL